MILFTPVIVKHMEKYLDKTPSLSPLALRHIPRFHCIHSRRSDSQGLQYPGTDIGPFPLIQNGHDVWVEFNRASDEHFI